MFLTNTQKAWGIHPSWNGFLNDQKAITELEKIEKALSKEKFYPLSPNVLRFLSFDLGKLKYVVLGMDPYPSSYKDKHGHIIPTATGRAFEVGDMTSWTDPTKNASIRNIFKTIYSNATGREVSKGLLDEARAALISGNFTISPPTTWFDQTEAQGVLWLNASLTVKPGKADSHKKLWMAFTDLLIVYIANKAPNAKFMAWGDKAQKKVKGKVSEDRIIKASHPRMEKFAYENCFQYVGLEAFGASPGKKSSSAI